MSKSSSSILSNVLESNTTIRFNAISRQSLMTPTDSGFTVRRRELEDTAARAPANGTTLSMDCVDMSVSMRPRGAKPGVLARLARQMMKTCISGHRACDGGRNRQRGGKQGNCRDTREFCVPGTVPGRNSGAFTAGPISCRPKKENFHVRLSGNPAIVGF